MTSVLLSELTSPDVRSVIEEGRVVVLPVGATEQHGPQLPLDTDIVISYEVAKAAAERTGSVVAPPIYYGISQHWMGFPGTMSIEYDTWIRFVTQVCQSLSKHGFRKVVILNGHGGNSGAIQLVAQNVAESSGGKTLVAAFSYWDVSYEQVNNIRGSAFGTMGHSCELETSLQLHLRQDLVKMERAVSNPRTRDSRFEPIDMMDPKRYIFVYTVGGGGASGHPGNLGVLGDPTIATKTNGKKFFDAIVGQVAGVLTELSNRSLD